MSEDQASMPRSRMVSLLLVLLLVCGAMLNDHYVKTPRSAAAIDRLNELIQVETDDGHGISVDLVQRTLGLKPVSKYQLKAYEVEEYEFRRTIPFFILRKLFVVYHHGGLATLFEGDRKPTTEMVRRKMGGDFIEEE